MKTVSDILNSKGHDVYSVSPGDSIYDSLKLMADKEVGALLVMDGEKLVGIVTERDYARKVTLEGKSSPPRAGAAGPAKSYRRLNRWPICRQQWSPG